MPCSPFLLIFCHFFLNRICHKITSGSNPPLTHLVHKFFRLFQTNQRSRHRRAGAVILGNALFLAQPLFSHALMPPAPGSGRSPPVFSIVSASNITRLLAISQKALPDDCRLPRTVLCRLETHFSRFDCHDLALMVRHDSHLTVHRRKDQTVADSLIECPVAGYDFLHENLPSVPTPPVSLTPSPLPLHPRSFRH